MKPEQEQRLGDLMDELQRGRVFECALRNQQWHLDGLHDRDRDSIYIDPRSAVLLTLLHELLHRRFPRLGERAVTTRSRQLFASMTEPTKVQWWRAYKRTVRKTGPVDVLDTP